MLRLKKLLNFWERFSDHKKYYFLKGHLKTPNFRIPWVRLLLGMRDKGGTEGTPASEVRELARFLSLMVGTWCSLGMWTLWKTVWNFLRKLNRINSATSFLDVHPREMTCQHKKLCMNIHNCTVRNSQKVETAHVSINRWMDKPVGPSIK